MKWWTKLTKKINLSINIFDIAIINDRYISSYGIYILGFGYLEPRYLFAIQYEYGRLDLDILFRRIIVRKHI